MRTRPDGPIMYVPTMDVFLNRWFRTYDEACAVREVDGGYLLPYGRHFFIADAAAIRELGMDPDDPDWERIGWDWIHPFDEAAWERLRLKREVAA